MKKILTLAAVLSFLGTGAIADDGKSSGACGTNATAFKRVLEKSCGKMAGDKRAKCVEDQFQKYSQKVKSCSDELRAVADGFGG